MMTRRWIEIQKEIVELKIDAAAAMRQELPVGKIVAYSHGKFTRYAEVVEHGVGCDRVEVQGTTGNSFWLHAYRILGMSPAPSGRTEGGGEDGWTDRDCVPGRSLGFRSEI